MADKLHELKKVAIRQIEDAPMYSDSPINGPSDAVRVLADELSQYDREVLMVVNMNAKGVPLNASICSIGTVNSALFYPRDILKSAILSNASSILVAHNHPSHSLEPSREDIISTDRMQQACSLIGIPILDHIIIGDKEHYYSFKEKQIMVADKNNHSVDINDIEIKSLSEQKESIHQKLERSQMKSKSTGKKTPERKEGKELC